MTATTMTAATMTATTMAATRAHHGRRNGELPDAVAKEVRAAARVRDLVELMARRPDLAGVYGAADLAAEAVRWSA
jgi:hypothetical protein